MSGRLKGIGGLAAAVGGAYTFNALRDYGGVSIDYSRRDVGPRNTKGDPAKAAKRRAQKRARMITRKKSK